VLARCPTAHFSDAHSDEIIGFVERPRARTRNIDTVSDLNDAAFVEASDAFNRWWQAGSGAAITAAELGIALLAALRDAGSPLVGEPDVARDRVDHADA